MNERIFALEKEINLKLENHQQHWLNIVRRAKKANSIYFFGSKNKFNFSWKTEFGFDKMKISQLINWIKRKEKDDIVNQSINQSMKSTLSRNLLLLLSSLILTTTKTTREKTQVCFAEQNTCYNDNKWRW